MPPRRQDRRLLGESAPGLPQHRCEEKPAAASSEGFAAASRRGSRFRTVEVSVQGGSPGQVRIARRSSGTYMVLRLTANAVSYPSQSQLLSLVLVLKDRRRPSDRAGVVRQLDRPRRAGIRFAILVDRRRDGPRLSAAVSSVASGGCRADAHRWTGLNLMLANNTGGRTSPYLISAPVDLALVGGLSVAVCAVYLWTDLGDVSARLLAGGVLTFFVNWPHFAATNVRLYGSRSSIAQYPITAVAAPLVVLLLVVASLRSPLLIAPAFFKMFLIWSPFHYSGQTLGVSLLYARRAGFRVETWCRAALSAFIYLTFISESAATELSPMGTLYFGVRLPTFNLPEGLPPFLRGAMYLAGGVGVVGLAIGSIRQRRAPPFPLLLVPISQYV